jgi:peptidoglycan/LPS O-acetylase OafA/YrhL
MVFLGTYRYGLYVYHHFISYYLTSNRTELELGQWLGSHALAVALQATLGISISAVPSTEPAATTRFPGGSAKTRG